MKKRRVLYLFLVLMLAMCMIPGCKNKDKKKETDTKEKAEMLERQEDAILPEDDFEGTGQDAIDALSDDTEEINAEKASGNKTPVGNIEQESKKDKKSSQDDSEDKKPSQNHSEDKKPSQNHSEDKKPSQDDTKDKDFPQDDLEDKKDSERKPIVLPGIKLED